MLTNTSSFQIHLENGRLFAKRYDQLPLTENDRVLVREIARNMVTTWTMDKAKPPETDDPPVPLDSWYPIFRQLHQAVVAEAGDFDYRSCRAYQPDLYRQIKDAEAAIDNMDQARLSEIVAAMQEWRGLILKACLEQRQGHKKKAVAG